MNAAHHATAHCISTTPAVFTVELSSRRIVAMAATQGVYSSVKTRKPMAARVESMDDMAAPPSRTSSVLTTDSFAIKPEMSAVAQRQSAKPSGANSGAIQRPIERQQACRAVRHNVQPCVKALEEPDYDSCKEDYRKRTLQEVARLFPQQQCDTFQTLAYGNSAAPLQMVRAYRERLFCS